MYARSSLLIFCWTCVDLHVHKNVRLNCQCNCMVPCLSIFTAVRHLHQFLFLNDLRWFNHCLLQVAYKEMDCRVQREARMQLIRWCKQQRLRVRSESSAIPSLCADEAEGSGLVDRSTTPDEVSENVMKMQSQTVQMECLGGCWACVCACARSHTAVLFCMQYVCSRGFSVGSHICVDFYDC